MKRFILSASAALAALTAIPLYAQTQPAAGAAAMTEAEVRKVDMQAKKITLKHGEIKNLDMPPMTMVFQVNDPALLEKVKTGDKVKFAAEKRDGTYTVTAIEPQN
jgi:Cu(I)/Ag(I) efflux system periplasmic protein CusF